MVSALKEGVSMAVHSAHPDRPSEQTSTRRIRRSWTEPKLVSKGARRRMRISRRVTCSTLIEKWGRLATCGGLVIRLPLNRENFDAPIANRPQVANLPHKHVQIHHEKRTTWFCNGISFECCDGALNGFQAKCPFSMPPCPCTSKDVKA